ncbi:MAG: sulfate adenylyltransferase [Marinomonas sp.]|uniref:transglutaminase-like cysteine peptidase n=1 Tax=Marinomonas communis TaxID=28254 RepID=UPI00100061EE|nr:transglutaminase-like cysteine peptidase [Marinomonas communis]MCC4274849.1 transglutaminase-like cysteine peptidase [Marinomonas communis]RUM49354.1 MAG: sulfate adenylyltransferase [Marinomonas sp.]
MTRHLGRFCLVFVRRIQLIVIVCALVVGGSASYLIADVSQKYINLAKRIGAQYGNRAELRIMAWRRTVEESRGLSVSQQLQNVNNFFNMLRFVSDQEHWGKNDYWATPIEFLATGGGDCEDFTIAKYFALRELGVPDDKLRLVYVKALRLNQHHMVLAYYHTPTSVPVILDNLDKTIKPAVQRNDLLPIYSFNAENLWLAKEKGRGQLVGGSSRLSLWTDLNNRLTDLEG